MFLPTSLDLMKGGHFSNVRNLDFLLRIEEYYINNRLFYKTVAFCI